MKRRVFENRPARGARLAAAVYLCFGTALAVAQQEQEQTGEPPGAQPGEEQPAQVPALEAPKTPVQSVDPALKGMFEQGAQRLHEAKTLSFHAKVFHTGTLLGKSPAAEADVKMVRHTGVGGQWLFRTVGAGGRSTTEPPAPFDVTWDRQVIRWLDIPAKKLMERPYGGAKSPLVQAAMAPVPTQLQELTTFSRELAAEVMTSEGTETMGGAACDVISVHYRARTGISKFWLGENDRLPRKIERISESTTYPNTSTYEISDLKIDEAIPDDQMTIALPEGFQLDSTVPTTTRPTPVEPTAQAPAKEPGVAAPPPPPQFPVAPAFTLSAADGSKVNLASLKGSVVVLYFWGTWSIPSRAADPEVQALQEKYKDHGVKVLGLSVREKTREAPGDMLKSLGRTYTNLLDADAVAHLYSVVRYPAFIVIDGEGRLRRSIDGFKADSTSGELQKAIDEVLGAAPAGSGG